MLFNYEVGFYWVFVSPKILVDMMYSYYQKSYMETVFKRFFWDYFIHKKKVSK